jgi:glycosyltransferase involved in cell wall biosynthesis
MRICIIGSSKRFFSGISAYTIAISNAFNKQGNSVSVILFRNLVPLFLYPGRSRVGKNETMLDFDSNIKVYDGMDWNSPRSWFGALRFLGKEKPDAIIMHWWTSSVAHMQLLLGIFRLTLKPKPLLILEMHEVVDTLEEKILPIRIYARVGGKALLKICDAFTAHSEEARQAIIKTYKLKENKIEVVPHGPYNIYGTLDRRIAREEMNLDGFTILYFGMIRQYKGVSLLARAFNGLPPELAKNMHLVIAGENWGDDPELLQNLENSPYKDRIIFKPEFIADDRIPQLFAAADIVVLPYTRTCGSGVLNIAIAQGKPVITSDLDTMTECLEGYGGAIFFPVGDVAALQDSLIKTYDRWVAGGTQTYQFTGTSWEAIVNKYETIIGDGNSKL